MYTVYFYFVDFIATKPFVVVNLEKGSLESLFEHTSDFVSRMVNLSKNIHSYLHIHKTFFMSILASYL